jgi:hypothetical protein
MCEVVGKSHTRAKATRDHKVVPLDNSKADISRSSFDAEWQVLVKKVICPVHKDEFKYFDESCGCVICRDCFALTHHGHKCLSMQEAANNCRGRLDGKCQEVKYQLESLKRTEKTISDTTGSLDTEYQNLRCEINSAFDKVCL